MQRIERGLPNCNNLKNKVFLPQLLEGNGSELDLQPSVEIQNLLQQFEDFLSEPKSLPLHRSYDHCIILQSDTKPIYMRP